MPQELADKIRAVHDKERWQHSFKKCLQELRSGVAVNLRGNSSRCLNCLDLRDRILESAVVDAIHEIYVHEYDEEDGQWIFVQNEWMNIDITEYSPDERKSFYNLMECYQCSVRQYTWRNVDRLILSMYGADVYRFDECEIASLYPEEYERQKQRVQGGLWI